MIDTIKKFRIDSLTQVIDNRVYASTKVFDSCAYEAMKAKYKLELASNLHDYRVPFCEELQDDISRVIRASVELDANSEEHINIVFTSYVSHYDLPLVIDVVKRKYANRLLVETSDCRKIQLYVLY